MFLTASLILNNIVMAIQEFWHIMFERIYTELRAVPATMLLLALLYLAVAGLYRDHVSSADFNVLKNEMSDIQLTLKRDHLDNRKHAIETELFSLTESISDKERDHLVVDELYRRRIDELKNEESELIREITALERSI
jgi:hypothetical protein